MLIVFVVSVFTAILPYIVVGRTSANFGVEWLDRDTLLLPLGISLCFLCLILFALSSEYLKNNAVAKFFLGFAFPFVLFLSFSLSTMNGQVRLLKDAIKQDAILSFMRNDSGFYKNYTFFFEDKSKDSNMFERTYRSYEPNGMAQSIFGDQKRFFLTTESLETVCPRKYKIDGICKDWQRSPVVKHFSIEKNPHAKLNSCKVLKLAFLKFFNKELYNVELLPYFLLTLR